MHYFFSFAGKAAIEIDDERTTTLIQKVNELLEAFIGIHDLDLGKKKLSHIVLKFWKKVPIL